MLFYVFLLFRNLPNVIFLMIRRESNSKPHT